MLQPTFTTERTEQNGTSATFVINPLPQGFGHTLGNALRRTLLSALSGFAATYIKINGVVHTFSVTKGIKESTLDLILNVKLLKFEAKGEGPFTITFSGKGKQKVYGKDFTGSGVKVVNGDQYIAEITDDSAKLDIELTIENGIGYISAEDHEKKEFGTLALDSVFTPVAKVNYKVEGSRVGRKTNSDRLTLDIETDGSISPQEALETSCNLLASFFMHVTQSQSDAQIANNSANEVETVRKVDKKVYQTIIDELDLPTRVINALLREKIETIEDLLNAGKENLINLKGVGKKSVDLIEKELEKLGISFEEK
jgi:DNA-directed RNA polymerase subunit alpha